MTARLIPPQIERRSFRVVLMAVCLGTVVGAVLGSVMWLVTGGLFWLWAVPLFALAGASVHRTNPNVLWWKRAP